MANGYYVFNFEKPKGFEFLEGQFGVFSHVNRSVEGKPTRAFSIASGKNENTIKIGVKIIESPSDFKKKMLEMIPGDFMSFRGPVGKFTLEEDHDSVLIAAGIGITPIRSLLLQMKDIEYSGAVDLIYSEGKECYPFKDEIDGMSFLKKHYLSTPEQTISTIKSVSDDYHKHTFYYVCGSPGFVKAIKVVLTENDVPYDHIKYDPFTGY